jgi:CRP/FNR family cyclic AMP-dependent transcriptional regulator
VKKLFDRLIGTHPAPGPVADQKESSGPDDEGYFATVFMEHPADIRGPQPTTPAINRSRLIGNEVCDAARGLAMLNKVWGHDRYMAALTPDERSRLAQYLEFVIVPAGREVIAQDQPGDFALIVLEGMVAVDRVQPWGARARLTEARDGDVLGELSLLDAGMRFSACVTLSRCVFAVITTQCLDNIARHDPRLGMALMASLARRLSLRMRQVSARLSALLSAT